MSEHTEEKDGSGGDVVEGIQSDVTTAIEQLCDKYDLAKFKGVMIITTQDGQSVTVNVSRDNNDIPEVEEPMDEEQIEVDETITIDPNSIEEETHVIENEWNREVSEEAENLKLGQASAVKNGENTDLNETDFKVIQLVEQESDSESCKEAVVVDPTQYTEGTFLLDSKTGKFKGRKRRASVVFRYSRKGSKGNKYTRSVVGPASCELCDFVATTQRSLQSHMSWKHGDREFQCQYEGKMFPTESALRRHYERSHLPRGQSAYCAYCVGFAYETDDQLREHILNAHPVDEGNDLLPVITLPKVTKTRAPSSDPAPPGTVVYYQCDICDYKSRNKPAMQVHHLRKHAPKVLKCRYCDMMWSDEKFRQAHEKNHAAQKSFVCNICGKRLSSKVALERHNKFFHSGGVREFACPECEKEFPTKEVLTLHVQRVHEGRKNFKCAECNYECFSREQMRHHMNQQHSSYRPYSCNYCGSAFVSGSTYRQHLKKVHNIENASISRLQFEGRGSSLKNVTCETEAPGESDDVNYVQCNDDVVTVTWDNSALQVGEDGVQYVVLNENGEIAATEELTSQIKVDSMVAIDDLEDNKS